MSLGSLFTLWFGFSRPVGRGAYAATGFGLMALKYLGDNAMVWGALGRWWSPLDYLSPFLDTREALIGGGAPAWLMPALVVWMLPFVWVGASMTMRRAVDAGFFGATGLVFFVPGLNYLWMLALCIVPRAASADASGEPEVARIRRSRRAAILHATWPSVLLGGAALYLSIFVVANYGGMLFVGTPVAMGFLSGLRAGRGEAVRAIVAGQLAILITGGVLLLFALEGALCLAMAWPLGAPLALIGSVIGAGRSPRNRVAPTEAALLLAVLPFLMALEAAVPQHPTREVVSVVEIDAPPERVWPHVIGFAELPPPSRLVFRLGIAYPMRARIEGEGAGAIRYCEFSTGPFVEPITHWEPPYRLAFDVASQPEPMHEASPYHRVHAPHLTDGLRSERGEFRLSALPGGRTKLEGSTWYRVRMAPQPYWGLLSDALIHRIHDRVLNHVRQLSEDSAAQPTTPSG